MAFACLVPKMTLKEEQHEKKKKEMRNQNIFLSSFVSSFGEFCMNFFLDNADEDEGTMK